MEADSCSWEGVDNRSMVEVGNQRWVEAGGSHQPFVVVDCFAEKLRNLDLRNFLQKVHQSI